MTNATEVFRASRDQLLDWRRRHEQAVAEFRLLQFDGPFNCVDWFDEMYRRSSSVGVAERPRPTTGVTRSW